MPDRAAPRQNPGTPDVPAEPRRSATRPVAGRKPEPGRRGAGADRPGGAAVQRRPGPGFDRRAGTGAGDLASSTASSCVRTTTTTAASSRSLRALSAHVEQHRSHRLNADRRWRGWCWRWPIPCSRTWPACATIRVLAAIALGRPGPVRAARSAAAAARVGLVGAARHHRWPGDRCALVRTCTWLLLLVPAAFLALVAWTFGRTLRAGSVPLITRMVVRDRRRAARGVDAGPASATRARLTATWAALLAGLALVNLAAGADRGARRPACTAWASRRRSTVSERAWSWFANLLNYGLVGGFFVGEYFYRVRRFPGRYTQLLRFRAQMAGLGPAVLARAAAGRAGSKLNTSGTAAAAGRVA